VTLIRQLIARGHAYEAGGEVLFDTQSMPDYGALSGRRLDEQLAGARVAVDAHKKNPADFVLWKQSSENEPGWESPWGRGRPGWHIECSAMSAAYLGDVFDIHGGGLDLIFPHHENEIAQSRCAHGTPTMANYWMHNGFLQVEGEKMSKSLGNFVTIRELLENWHGYSWPGETLRFNMLRTHYRQPIDWTYESLNESHNILCDWYDDLKGLQSDERISEDALRWLSDDLNTPGLIGELHKLRKQKLFQSLLATLELLGFSGKRENLRRTAFATVNVQVRATVRGELRVTEAPDGMEAQGKVIPSSDEIDKLITARSAARARRDFGESDRIRDELAAMGVVIKDSKDGTTWEIAR
jgi:cysteinyl-tRNA synthetase